MLQHGTELETAALKEGEYVAVRRFVRLLERGGDAKVQFKPELAKRPMFRLSRLSCDAPLRAPAGAWR